MKQNEIKSKESNKLETGNLFSYIASVMDNLFRSLLEKQVFGVCNRIGEKTGMSTERIRLFFLYSSCITFGSPLVIYLVLAFWVDVRKVFRKSTIWEF